MPDINFPISPSLNEEYSYNNNTWKWDGNKWILVYNKSIQGIQGIQGNNGIDYSPICFYINTTSATGLYNFNATIPAGEYIVEFSDTNLSVQFDTYLASYNSNYYSGGRSPFFGGFLKTSTDYTGLILIGKSVPRDTGSFVFSTQNTPISIFATSNDIMFAISSTNEVATSTTGISWSLRTTGLTLGSGSGDFGTGIYLLGKTDGGTISSTDLTTWTAASNTGTSNSILKYLNSLWISVGTSGLISTSTNGTSWTTNTRSFTGTPTNLIYVSGTYVLSTSVAIYTSTDLITWNTSLNQAGKVVYGNNIYVVLNTARNTFYISSDLSLWTSYAAPFSFGALKSFDFGGGLFWMAGVSGISGINGWSYKSLNGINWIPNENAAIVSNTSFSGNSQDSGASSSSAYVMNARMYSIRDSFASQSYSTPGYVIFYPVIDQTATQITLT